MGGRYSGFVIYHKASMYPSQQLYSYFGVLASNVEDDDMVRLLVSQLNDGDQMNLICSFTEESKNEIKQYKKEKKAYINSDGRIRYPLGFDTINFVCHNLGTFEESVK